MRGACSTPRGCSPGGASVLKWGLVFSGENLSLEEVLGYAVEPAQTRANHDAIIDAFAEWTT